MRRRRWWKLPDKRRTKRAKALTVARRDQRRVKRLPEIV